MPSARAQPDRKRPATVGAVALGVLIGLVPCRAAALLVDPLRAAADPDPDPLVRQALDALRRRTPGQLTSGPAVSPWTALGARDRLTCWKREQHGH